MTSPLQRALEDIQWWLIAGARLSVLILLAYVAVMLLTGAVAHFVRPLQPRAEWLEHPRSNRSMSFTVIGAAAGAFVVLIVAASVVADFYLRVRAGGGAE